MIREQMLDFARDLLALRRDANDGHTLVHPPGVEPTNADLSLVIVVVQGRYEQTRWGICFDLWRRDFLQDGFKKWSQVVRQMIRCVASLARDSDSVDHREFGLLVAGSPAEDFGLSQHSIY